MNRKGMSKVSIILLVVLAFVVVAAIVLFTMNPDLLQGRMGRRDLSRSSKIDCSSRPNLTIENAYISDVIVYPFDSEWNRYELTVEVKNNGGDMSQFEDIVLGSVQILYDDPLGFGQDPDLGKLFDGEMGKFYDKLSCKEKKDYVLYFEVPKSQFSLVGNIAVDVENNIIESNELDNVHTDIYVRNRVDIGNLGSGPDLMWNDALVVKLTEYYTTSNVSLSFKLYTHTLTDQELEDYFDFHSAGWVSNGIVFDYYTSPVFPAEIGLDQVDPIGLPNYVDPNNNEKYYTNIKGTVKGWPWGTFILVEEKVPEYAEAASYSGLIYFPPNQE
jgi:hypothetical protein